MKKKRKYFRFFASLSSLLFKEHQNILLGFLRQLGELSQNRYVNDTPKLRAGFRDFCKP